MIEIHLTKQILILEESELSKLLARDPTLWATALKRGKAIQRNEREVKRNASKRLEKSSCE